MHRDKKLGLALGILLIGAVGAFFFRNEPDPTVEIPELQDPQAIDNQIREQAGSLPYLKDIEPVVSAGGHDRENSRPGRRFERPDFLGAADSDSPGSQAPAWEPGAPPDPIPSARGTLGGSISVAVPEQNRTSPASVEADSQQSSWNVPANLSGEAIWHRVKPGETLTGLAARYLGSSADFMKLYRANRDQLKNPDDLRTGITIRIPKHSGRGDSPAEPATATTEPADTTGSQPPTQTKRHRFIPVPRNPLMPNSAGSNRIRKSGEPSAQVPAPPETSSGKRSEEDDTHQKTTVAGDAARPRVESAGSEPQPRRYTVRRGDSLEKIALRFYSSRSATEKIFRANRHQLNKRNLLREGMTIVLP